MTELSVIFLWHMHQPYYRDMVQGNCILPWVRLHAIKGYRDVLRATELSAGAKVVINLTPCLVRQIQEMVEGHVRDDFFLISEKPTDELSLSERAFILRYFFMADWETMVRPYGEYLKLLAKRGTRSSLDFETVAKKFSDQEIRDLVVWFNLTWFGWAALEDIPELLELKGKGRNFTEEDKALVLSSQLRLLSEVLPAYQRLWTAGEIEVSTTPLYHPILPLLWDTVFADRCRPGVKLPVRFRHPEDAWEQVRQGLEVVEKSLGRRPQGMWPSEGSVCHELVPMFLDAGLKWIATDEDILFKRVRVHRRDEVLYHPWKVPHEGRELNVFFRDHGLSDLIGFTYAKQPAEAAAEDLCRRLRELRSSIARQGQDHAVVAIILDGENPWQAYPDGGRGFLLGLYQRILNTPGLQMVTCSEYLERHPPSRPLDYLPTGSWINQNFQIWIGGPEENLAWEYLGRVREQMPDLIADAPEGVKEEAWQSLYAAEGSDWFWWYGDDFQSDLKCEFDYLFRLHLKNVYLLLGEAPPLFLNEPVTFDHPVRLQEEPMAFLSPLIDGRVSDYYEWQAAGHMDIRQAQGAMYQALKHLHHIYYGFDLANFYLRLDPAPQHNNTEHLDVRVHLLNPRRQVIIFPFVKPTLARLFEESPDGTLLPAAELQTVAAEKIIELQVPFPLLGLEKGQEVQFVVELYEADTEVERYPRDGFVSFAVPDESFEEKYWSV